MPDHRPVAVAESRCASRRRGPRTAARPCGPRSPRARRARSAAPRRSRSSSRMAKAAGCTPRNGTLLGSVSPWRGRSTITTSSAEASGRPSASRAMPGSAPSSDRLVARHAARQLGVGAGAQHDHAARRARCWPACGGSPPPSPAPRRARRPRRRCRSRRPARCRAAAGRPQVDQRDLDDLVEPAPWLSGARPARRRSAAGARAAPAAARSPRASPTASRAGEQPRARRLTNSGGKRPPVGAVEHRHAGRRRPPCRAPPPRSSSSSASAEHERGHLAVGEAERLEDGQLRDALADRLRHGVAGQDQDREEHRERGCA